MCYSCFEEAGSPNIINERTFKGANIVTRLYEQEGCEVGGYGHIVFDDWNLSSDNIEWCINEAEKGGYDFIPEEGRIACIKTLKYFLELTEPERYSALAINHNFIQ
jgi:hypothetical protein